MFAIWSNGAKAYCPIMLQHMMDFLQPRVEFNENRRQPMSKNELQPHLRLHISAFLTASPVTSKMVIEAALKRLMRYAKVFGSESMLEQLAIFADPVICQYLVRELQEVSEQLDKVRQQLRLADECCDDVLNRSDFIQSAMNWHRTEPSMEDTKYLTRPASINDGDAARSQKRTSLWMTI
jgi:hypothetical protein